MIMSMSERESSPGNESSLGNESFKGRRVVIMGLGRFGGGAGAARYLAEQGAHVLVTDCADAEELRKSVDELSDLSLEYRLGGHCVSDLDGCDLVVVNPSVQRQRSAFFAEIKRRCIPWTTEINLFLERCPARIIGVTGTAGKSTVVSMIHEILRRSNEAPRRGNSRWRSYLGGNIGRSLLSELSDMTPEDVVVLELSSYQLSSLTQIKRRPDISVFTAIWPNHLDWHVTYESYLEAKLNLISPAGHASASHATSGHGSASHASAGFDPAGLASAGHTSGYDGSAGGDSGDYERTVIVGTDDPEVRPKIERLAKAQCLRVVDATIDDVSYVLRIPGSHTQLNARCAAAACRAVGVDEDVIQAGLECFEGLRHRLQWVARVDGLDYYNDSKATTTRAVLQALTGFDRPIVLLAGGMGRGESLDAFARSVAGCAKAVICFGDVAHDLHGAMKATAAVAATGVIAASAEAASTERAASLILHQATDLAGAVAIARQVASTGDVVVMSPGFQSYDTFLNYEHRGDAFIRIVLG